MFLTSFSNLSRAFSAEACSTSCSSSSLNNALVSVSTSSSSSPSTSPSPFPMPGSQGSHLGAQFLSHLTAQNFYQVLAYLAHPSCIQSSVSFARVCQKFPTQLSSRQ